MNLHKAIASDDFKTFEALLRGGANPLEVDEFGNNVLHFLAYKVDERGGTNLFSSKRSVNEYFLEVDRV